MIKFRLWHLIGYLILIYLHKIKSSELTLSFDVMNRIYHDYSFNIDLCDVDYYLNVYEQKNIDTLEHYINSANKLCILEKYKPFRVVSCDPLFLVNKSWYEFHGKLIYNTHSNLFKHSYDGEIWNTHVTRTFLVKYMLLVMPFYPHCPGTYINIKDWLTGTRFNQINTVQLNKKVSIEEKTDLKTPCDTHHADQYTLYDNTLWKDIVTYAISLQKRYESSEYEKETAHFLVRTAHRGVNATTGERIKELSAWSLRHVYFKIGSINFFLNNMKDIFSKEKYFDFKSTYCLPTIQYEDPYEQLFDESEITGSIKQKLTTDELIDYRSFVLQLDYYKNKSQLPYFQQKNALVISALSLRWLINNINKFYAQEIINRLLADIDEIKITYGYSLSFVINIPILEEYMQKKYNVQVFLKNLSYKLNTNTIKQNIKNALNDANNPFIKDQNSPYDQDYVDFFTLEPFSWKTIAHANSLSGIIAIKSFNFYDDELHEISTDEKIFFDQLLKNVSTLKIKDQLNNYPISFIRYILKNTNLKIKCNKIMYINKKSLISPDSGSYRTHSLDFLNRHNLLDLFLNRLLTTNPFLNQSIDCITIKMPAYINSETLTAILSLPLIYSMRKIRLVHYTYDTTFRFSFLIKENNTLFVTTPKYIKILDTLIFNNNQLINLLKNVNIIIVDNINNTSDLIKQCKKIDPNIKIEEYNQSSNNKLHKRFFKLMNAHEKKNVLNYNKNHMSEYKIALKRILYGLIITILICYTIIKTPLTLTKKCL